MADAVYTLSGEELSNILAGLADKAARLNWSEPLKRIAFYLASEAMMCFDEGREPGGTPWAPLKNPSAKRGGTSAKPLRDTDILMASMAGRGSGNITSISGKTLVYGTNVDYAAFHQYGTSRIPARPFLGMTAAMKVQMRLIVIDWLKSEAAKA